MSPNAMRVSLDQEQLNEVKREAMNDGLEAAANLCAEFARAKEQDCEGQCPVTIRLLIAERDAALVLEKRINALKEPAR